MAIEQNDLNDIKLKIGLMEKDVSMTDKLCNKLSESIAKIQELNVNLLQMINIQEQKHEQHEKTENEVKRDIRDLHDRIDQVERHISQRIDDLRSDLLKHKKEDTNVKLTELMQEIDKYKWMFLGAALMIGWIFGNLDLTVIGTLFK